MVQGRMKSKKRGRGWERGRLRKRWGGGKEEKRNIQAFEMNYCIKTNVVPLHVLT